LGAAKSDEPLQLQSFPGNAHQHGHDNLLQLGQGAESALKQNQASLRQQFGQLRMHRICNFALAGCLNGVQMVVLHVNDQSYLERHSNCDPHLERLQRTGLVSAGDWSLDLTRSATGRHRFCNCLKEA
jgi:hypothetical protein